MNLGVEKSFGMAKWRKSQKILREKKAPKNCDYIPTPPVFQERPVDVPTDFRQNNRPSDESSKENRYKIDIKPSIQTQHGSKSATTTPNLSRKKNCSKRFDRNKKIAQSLPSRRVKNSVPFDV